MRIRMKALVGYNVCPRVEKDQICFLITAREQRSELLSALSQLPSPPGTHPPSDGVTALRELLNYAQVYITKH